MFFRFGAIRFLCGRTLLNMIQRIQTVYLAVATVILLTLVLLNLELAAIVASETVRFQLSTISMNVMREEVSDRLMTTAPIVGSMILGLALSVYAIFQFKNRKFQVKLVQGAMLVQLVIAGLVFFYADRMSGLAGSDDVAYNPALAALPVNVILYFLAIRGIKKDDALVRSADRLR